ncbi:unnamed protein product [Polarella glacialis]|uniref:Alpha 1,4-glycosyltransferase domain-containing protein n=1 Tax=Polarella glacialis TaxID=89957 RepID=A0A813HP61_POLGL|nr:unnamed protein product [Polarella glacialis]
MTYASPEEELEVLSELFSQKFNIPSTPAMSLAGQVQEQTIWGYWAEQDSMPELVHLCVETWRSWNPGWDVRLLGLHNVYEFLSEAELPNRFSEMQLSLASDGVRLALLARYGGVWLDTSVILRSSLESFCWTDVAVGRQEAAAFPVASGSDTLALGGVDSLQTWCLATRPWNPFFMRWRDVHQELLHNRVDIHDLLRHPLCSELGALSSQTELFGEGLACEVAFQKLLLATRKAAQSWKMLEGKSVFQLRQVAHDRGESLVDLLLRQDTYAEEHQLLGNVPLLKLDAAEQQQLQQLPREQLLDSRTLLGRLLGQRGPHPGINNNSNSNNNRGGGGLGLGAAGFRCKGRSGSSTALAAGVVAAAARSARRSHCSSAVLLAMAGLRVAATSTMAARAIASPRLCAPPVTAVVGELGGFGAGKQAVRSRASATRRAARIVTAWDVKAYWKP